MVLNDVLLYLNYVALYCRFGEIGSRESRAYRILGRERLREDGEIAGFSLGFNSHNFANWVMGFEDFSTHTRTCLGQVPGTTTTTF